MASRATAVAILIVGLVGIRSCDGDPITGAKMATGGAAVGAGVGAGIGAGAAGAGAVSGVKRGMHDRARDWVARPNGPSRPGPTPSTIPQAPLLEVNP